MKVRILAVSAVTAGLALGTAACSSSGGTSASSSAAPKSSSSAMASSSAAAMPSSSGSGSASATDFGSGCASVPRSGAGSFSGMSTAPVATAAAANPVLSTLVAAAKKAKIPSATLNSVLANKTELTKILTYHVASGRYTPAELASGKPIKTLEGATVKPSMSGGTYSVNGAQVVCGNVQTANATVYIIGTVLMPPSS